MYKLTIALFAILAVCTAVNTKCSDLERTNQFCSMIYKPVCGITVSKENSNKTNKVTFPNRCHACKSSETLFFAEGACNSYPENAVFCHPDAVNNKMCTKEYIPVCGIYEKTVNCIKAPCGETYPNKCHACISGKSSYFVPGNCNSE
ncbi:kazal-type proteinase inhibitor 1 (macronuclear) [Tetrahymena thermophila SB210]|uniref:Kazal-type proteinase inhibitor 1 n=1 Tax=Tetrahymena thermophila (strain SB210) TaxID=312017 RepID=Q232G6_TETTS|nr:kazal-type proteinase inhibitor 1 [Tetrahymena thermophila SB210]EAR91446.1 kazal-type proteinase inhibitor 1 [Tetrahymena thermophila SB210]|eukprot:XP_001011691.1 kazal-type proteinase inhibitor 1 [Tetrahymena thermophila SB210]